MKILYFTLFIHLFLLHCVSCLFGRNAQSATTTSDIAEEEECTEPCRCLQCNNILANPRKIINPYRDFLENRVRQKPFGNFCVKCAACLAVASEIQNVIENGSEECETDGEKKRNISRDVARKITELCRTGFKNFNLRSFNNHGVFTDNLQCTTNVDDGVNQENWTKRLRDICSLYVSRVDLEDVALKVLESTLTNLTQVFCRGNGIFRDCVNIKSHENIILPCSQACHF